jgi:hypothetical protein
MNVDTMGKNIPIFINRKKRKGKDKIQSAEIKFLSRKGIYRMGHEKVTTCDRGGPAVGGGGGEKC